VTSYVDKPVLVRVPATSANLGPGFDALGLALSLHDEVEVRVTRSGLRVEVFGEGAGSVARDESHLVVRAMAEAFDLLGGRPSGLEVACGNRIPHGRGLGSSAAAIVAGVVAARALAIDGAARLDDTALLALATEIEGHPDNVAACLLGGLTVAWTETGGARAVRLEPASGLAAVAFVPAAPVSTAQVRRLLPDCVPHADAALTAGRSALLVAALTGRPELLLPATEDRLHQNYRAQAMPDSAALVAALRADGVPAVVSGAGPSVLALVSTTDADRVAALAPPGFAVRVLAPDLDGVRVLPSA
jgi:homoserine kinase